MNGWRAGKLPYFRTGILQTIMHNWYDEILQVLDDDERQVIKETDILTWFQNNEERYDNIRLLKNKMEQAIYEKLATTFAIEKKGEER